MARRAASNFAVVDVRGVFAGGATGRAGARAAVGRGARRCTKRLTEEMARFKREGGGVDDREVRFRRAAALGGTDGTVRDVLRRCGRRAGRVDAMALSFREV